jgi:hypothetical protein
MSEDVERDRRTWFVIEADVSARELVEDQRLAFFTVRIVKHLDERPSDEQGVIYVAQYLQDAHIGFDWDARLVSIEKTEPPPEWAVTGPAQGEGAYPGPS